MNPSMSRKIHPAPRRKRGYQPPQNRSGMLMLFVLSLEAAVTVAGGKSAEPAEAGQIGPQVSSDSVSTSSAGRVKQPRSGAVAPRRQNKNRRYHQGTATPSNDFGAGF